VPREDLLDRLRTLARIVDDGIDPYPHTFRPSHSIAGIRRNNEGGIRDTSTITTAGRIMSIRRHGGALFADLVDEGERLQIHLRADELGDKYRWFLKNINRGDFLGVKGELFYTKKGELTLLVRDYLLLAKSLLELPSRWYGLRDIEERYRKRYLDLLLNQEARRVFVVRYRLIRELRRLLEERGFIEVETPVLQPLYGGAAARPFRTIINALSEEWYLRISEELPLKKLLVAGFDKVFEIGKVFRNEDIDVMHNPEFTMLEAYQAYADYNDMMELAESVICEALRRVVGGYKLQWMGRELDFTPPWRRMRFYDAIERFAQLDPLKAEEDQLISQLSSKGIQVPPGMPRGLLLEKLFDAYCKPHLLNPTFVLDYPRETTPLCKPHRSEPGLVERFELFIGGLELANAYTELNNPLLQHRFFLEEQRVHAADVEVAHRYDADFIEALMYGMPPAGGIGIGIDRLAMLFSGASSIKEVLLSPILKRVAQRSPFEEVEIEQLTDKFLRMGQGG
jgi:lysyl-tRNA synthetase class 2